MRKIINSPSDFVDESIDGILLAHPESLRAASPDRRVLVRADAPRAGKVGIVTGGGSGHLPVFLGYVGHGLCDGVAVGNVFSSPSAAQIHAATQAVSGGAGVLYLYGNYGGDIYNFDLAGDLALGDGIPTATVLAADDVASAPLDKRGTRRGVAGMIYAFKIAGAAAERGDSLERVAELARRASDNARTMGVGLSPTILPAAGEPSFTLEEGEMEVGVGIHGEPGIHRGRLETADAIVERLLGAVLDDLSPAPGSTVSVLVNGLGATPLEELYVLYRRVHAVLTERGIAIHSPFVGNYVTSLEMAGASISLLLLDDELTELLDAPAASPFFRHGGAVEGGASGAGRLAAEGLDAPGAPSAPSAPLAAASTAPAPGAADAEPTPLAALLTAVLTRLPDHADELRELDAALGDGDLGITVASGSDAIRESIARDPGADDATLLRRAGAAFAEANPSTYAALVGGGLLYATSRLAAGTGLDRTSVLAFGRDVQARIAERGGAAVGDKTVLDVLDSSLAVAEANPGLPTAELLDAMIAAAADTIDRTSALVSARGRAAWLRERSAGLRDPGMTAYLAFLQELRAAVAPPS